MAAVTLQAVTKSYDGKQQIIQPLDVSIRDGEFMVMVGPSGCGKSTLLRMVAGLERVTSGDIYIDAERMTEKEPKDRGIAMVFQNYALYPHMTVAGNGAQPGAGGVAEASAARAFRRSASARGDGTRHRARTGGVSV